MNKLDVLAAQKKPLLACYLPFADPFVSDELMAMYAKCGVDIIEIGLPCENPYADGLTVASSMRRAFLNNPKVEGIADKLAQIRSELSQQGLVLMGYQNNMDIPFLLNNSAQYIDGVLCLGDVAESNASWRVGDREIYRIVYVSHKLTEPEVLLSSAAKGYIMLQAVDGVTGARDEIPDNSRQIARIKGAGANVSVLLGFGISRNEHIRKAMAMGADGVVIGSACLTYAVAKDWAGLEEFLKGIRATLNEFQ